MQPSGDADAQAFITAAGITDSTQKSAIQTLVTDLKGYGIWTKMKAIYPFVGGTATTHKYNLKDPQDTDGAFRLVFNGGWTHSSNGAEANGSNAYADTKLNPISVLTTYNSHSSIYQRKQSTGGFDLGVTNSYTYSKEFLLATGRSGQEISALYDYGNANAQIVLSTSDGRKFLQNSITSTTSHKLYRNGSVVGTNTNTNNTEPHNVNIYIGAVNGAVAPVEYASSQYAFASLGDGLNDTESSNLYTAVQAFQTTLGRQI